MEKANSKSSRIEYALIIAVLVLFGSWNLAEATSTFVVQQGGTGSTTLTGLLKGNGINPVQTAIPGTDYQLPLSFPISIANGGTATTSAVTNGVYYYNGTNAEADSLLTFDGSSLSLVPTSLQPAIKLLATGQPTLVLNGFSSSIASLSWSSGSSRTLKIGNTSDIGNTSIYLGSQLPGGTGTTLIGIGATTTAFAELSIAGSAGGTTPLFAVSSSTAGFATSTPFEIDKNGNVGINNGATLSFGWNPVAGQSQIYEGANAGTGLRVNANSAAELNVQGATILSAQLNTISTRAGDSIIPLTTNTGSIGTAASLYNQAHFTFASTTALTISLLGTSAGSFLAVDPQGNVIATTTPSGGSGITSIGPTGQLQTGPTITIATSTASFNGLTVGDTWTGSGNTLTTTPTWSGQLNISGGGTGTTTPGVTNGVEYNNGTILTNATGFTFSSSNLTIPSGGAYQINGASLLTSTVLAVATIRGGAAATSNLTIQGTTSGSPTTGGSIIFQPANSTEIGRLTAAGLGLGTTTPFTLLDVASTSASASNFGQLALTDTNAGTNLKHWLFSSMGGSFFLGTTTDKYATSTVNAIAIDPNGKVSVNNLVVNGTCTGCASGGTYGNGAFATTTFPAGTASSRVITTGFLPGLITFSWNYLTTNTTISTQGASGQGSWTTGGNYAETFIKNGGGCSATLTESVAQDTSAVISGQTCSAGSVFVGSISNVTSTGFTITITETGGVANTPTINVAWAAQK